MAEVVGVVFPGGVKVYHFDPAGLELIEGDRVVVQTSNGPEIGEVVEPTQEIDDAELPAALKKVQRVATEKDFETQAATDSLRREAMATCRELIRTHGLDMKLVGAEMGFGGDKITFSFFSEERVDFRALVADLSKELKARIELRQVGAREEARMVGGLGPCGRALCCTVFPGDDDPVSIRMAKEQNLPLNPTKISGLCGRLMCCLKYEQDQYVGFRKESPAKGTKVCTPEGDGVVCGYMLTKDSLAVKMDEGGHTEVRLCECECQKDGSLLVTPEEKPPPPPLWEGPIGLGLSSAGTDAEAPKSATGGDAGEGGKAEGDKPARSRKSRNRRKGRGNRGQGQAESSGGQTAKSGSAQGGAGGAKQGSGQPGNQQRKNENGGAQGQARRSRRRRPRRPSRSSGGQGGQAGQNSGGSKGGGSKGGASQE